MSRCALLGAVSRGFQAHAVRCDTAVDALVERHHAVTTLPWRRDGRACRGDSPGKRREGESRTDDGATIKHDLVLSKKFSRCGSARVSPPEDRKSTRLNSSH